MSIIQKVITEESGKVFNFNSDVFIFDYHGDVDYTHCSVNWSNPLPVCDESGRKIGSVNLFLENNILVGSFSLDYATPERLNIQTGIPMYPHVGQSSTVMVEKDGGKYKMEYFDIDSIVLSLMPGEDRRIAQVY